MKPKRAQKYYLFGSIQPGRNFNAGNYRFGFNGKENDNEIKGTGNSVDFGARIYDSRLGRWFKIDPLFREYAAISPYAFVANSPIYFVDEDGKKLKANTTQDFEMIYNLLLSIYAEYPEILSKIKAAKDGKTFEDILGYSGSKNPNAPAPKLQNGSNIIGRSIDNFLEDHGIDPESDLGVFTRELITVINDPQVTVYFSYNNNSDEASRSHYDPGEADDEDNINDFYVKINYGTYDYNEVINGGIEVQRDDCGLDKVRLSVTAKTFHEIFEAYAKKGYNKKMRTLFLNDKTNEEIHKELNEANNNISLYTIQMENVVHRIIKDSYYRTGSDHNDTGYITKDNVQKRPKNVPKF